MVGVDLVGNIDLASVSIWMFWIFFALLIYYIHRENMREGFPLEDDNGARRGDLSGLSTPHPKTFERPHGQPSVTVPSLENEEKHARRDLALERTNGAEGFPMMPTGDAMSDGVGPAAWAPREDVPELDGHGHPKIQPMSQHDGFFVSAGYDPRGLPVVCKDDKVVGNVTDLWIDVPEQMVRYVEFEIDPEFGSGKRLAPMTMVKVTSRWVDVTSLKSDRIDGIPQTKSMTQITKLEEEKNNAWFAAGLMYNA